MSGNIHLTREELVRRLEVLEANPPTITACSDSEERLRAILQTAVEGIITIDEQGIIESVNPAAERMFGYAAPELVGRNVSVLMPPPDCEHHDRYLADYRSTGKARVIGIGREVTGRRRDGSTFPLDLAVSEVRLASKRLFTGFVRDVGERKRNEAKVAELIASLAEKNKELEAIVYVASHDLRSPLVNIQGFSQELARACEQVRASLSDSSVLSPGAALALREDIPEALSFIRAGVQKMDALLSGFLRYSRLGRAALKLERIDMNATLARIAKSIDFQLKQAGAVLEFQPLPDCIGDATQIDQVFTNIIDNAVKYRSPKRPGRIVVTGHREADLSCYVIEDNGIGIAPQHQQKIFEIFHRLNPEHGNGDGLGLTIAQRILERHSGKITVQSVPGEGSRFLVAIPH